MYLGVAAVAILMASAGSIVALQNHSSRQYQAAVEIDELGLVTYHYFISLSDTTQAFNPPTSTPNEVTQTEQTASLAALAEAYERYQSEAGQEWHSDLPVSVAALVASLDTTRSHVLQGRYGPALASLDSANDEYYVVAKELHAASASYLNRALHVERLARLATLGVYAVTALLGVGIYRVFRRRQMRHEQAEVEYEILKRSEAKFRPLVQSSVDLISVVNGEGIIQYASPSVERLAGVGPEGAVGKSTLDFIAPADRHLISDFIDDVRARPGYSSTVELKLQSGIDLSRTKYVQMTGTNLLDNPDVHGVVLNVRDITEGKELEAQLRHQAFHDSLTGLANRLRFMDRLDHALTRRGALSVSVLYLDLDHFKNVNDELGHAAGDELLKTVAQRIFANLRPNDTAARLGGDEFAVLLEDSGGLIETRKIAEALLDSIALPVRISDRDVTTSASLGLAVAEATTSAEEIVRDADIAMYDAKKNGRGCVQVYEPAMQFSLVERLTLTHELAGAAGRGELRVYYQPTWRLDTEVIVGFEALVRWEHPTRGFLLPSRFISLAEESGSIIELGRHVLRTACHQAKDWQSLFPQATPLTMSVNVSPRQLQRPGFVEVVEEVLSESGLRPDSLVLEITESILIERPQSVLAILEQLKSLGIRLALDDFGTGYSSLSYLNRFPIDILKIDRAFIDGMDLTNRDHMMVQTVVDLGHLLNLEIVAEGIERSTQLSQLRDLNCNFGQGFLFAEPLSAEDANALLRDSESVVAAA